MEIVKIIGFGIFGAVVSVIVKQYKPEYSFILQTAITVTIAAWSLSYISAIADTILIMGGVYSVDSSLIIIPVKALGISLLAQMSADLCRDSGNSAIASKIEFAGRVIIIAMSMPILKSLTEFAAELLKS